MEKAVSGILRCPNVLHCLYYDCSDFLYADLKGQLYVIFLCCIPQIDWNNLVCLSILHWYRCLEGGGVGVGILCELLDAMLGWKKLNDFMYRKVCLKINVPTLLKNVENFALPKHPSLSYVHCEVEFCCAITV